MPQAPTILLFDSGLGGLTVYQEVRSARPDANFIYIADDAGFPYGNLDEDRLVERVIDIMGRAIADHAPDLAVVACNTASTLALGELRAHFRVPFVGTVPAIKPACAQSTTKRVAVLGTQATIGREYTHALIREFGSGCDVHLVGSARLAACAEAELAGAPAPDAVIAGEIGRCFLDEDGRRTDTIVLACTHYPLLLDRFRANARWPVSWLDPAPAIARRVADLMRARPNGTPPAAPRIVFTSGRTPSPALSGSLARYGF